MHIIMTFTHVYQLQNNGSLHYNHRQKTNAGHYGNLLLEQIILKVLSYYFTTHTILHSKQKLTHNHPIY